jgi:large subunit ribosomal protein L31
MKEKTHPPYQEVLFVDSATGKKFLIGSTLQPKEKEKFEGKEYPISRVPVSSASHPFFNKSNSDLMDSEGRVKQFKNKYQRKTEEVKQSQEKQEEANKAKVKAPAKKR